MIYDLIEREREIFESLQETESINRTCENLKIKRGIVNWTLKEYGHDSLYDYLLWVENGRPR